MTASLSICILSYEFRQNPVGTAVIASVAGAVGYGFINYVVPTEIRFVVVSLLLGLTAYQISDSVSTDKLLNERTDSKTMLNQEHKDPRITCQFVDMKQLQGVVSDHIIKISPEGSESLIDTIKNAACAQTLQHIAQAEDSIRSVCEYLAPKHFDGIYFNDKVYKNNNVLFVQEDAKLILLITIDRQS